MCEVNTLHQLLELYQQSRMNGEEVSLSMEAKDGKDFITFSIGSPTGAPAWRSKNCPAWTGPVRRKTPSQIRRDQRRKELFLSKKSSAVPDVKVENMEEKATLSDEIKPTEQNDDIEKESVESTLFKITGEYKNPKFKPWNNVEPKKDLETLWELLKHENEKIGIEEIGEGSTCFEHCLEFWGTWRSSTGITPVFLRDSKNWPKGVKILEVKPVK